MSDLRSLKGFQRACEKRKSLEEKTKIFEENARKAKLSIDRQLLVQILQEINHMHDDTVKELEEKLQEENRTHDDAVKELEEKIADLEQQTKRLSKVEDIPNETPSEPTQEVTEPALVMTEPPQKTSTGIDETVRARALQERVRDLLQESGQSGSEVPQEAPKKKKRTPF